MDELHCLIIGNQILLILIFLKIENKYECISERQNRLIKRTQN